jgi:hypothetical protein
MVKLWVLLVHFLLKIERQVIKFLPIHSGEYGSFEPESIPNFFLGVHPDLHLGTLQAVHQGRVLLDVRHEQLPLCHLLLASGSNGSHPLTANLADI